eukprot:scaffold1909_cov131-Skeletonema_marinoi.AAC.3
MSSTPLHDACQKDKVSLDEILELLNKRPDDVMKKNQSGWLPIHVACFKGQSIEVINALIKEYPDGLKALIKEYPEALGKRDFSGRTPFEWDYEESWESCGGQFKEFIQNLSSRYSRHLPRYQRILTHCKNYMPLDILRIGFLDEKTLESHSFTEWLNGMLFKRSVVCMMVLEFYLHMAWIYTFVSASHIYFVKSDEPLGWRPTALLVFAAIFLLEEIGQFIRLYFTGAVLHYCTDLWNWIDVVTCVMVIVSAARFLDEDSSIDGRLLMTTGCFQSLLLLSYLKKTFSPFSKFVSGVIKIIWAVLPFLVVSTVTLFTFSFMYFVQDQDKLKKSDLVLVFNNTNNSNLEDDASFASLMLSFQTVFDKFAGGAKESLSALDFFFGIFVVVVLLNVVIAVVSDEWEKAGVEANEAFWKYRLDLIIDKTRGLSLYWSLCHIYNGAAGLAGLFGCSIPKIPRELIREWELEWNFNENDYCGLGSHLDDTFINKKTVGTTLEEFKLKLAVKNKEDGMFACIKLLVECFLFFVLGFPTFGLLWPKFIRQMLFTSSKPKESSDADSEREREITKEVSKLSKKVVDQNESLAEYKKTVSELSQKVSAQNDLLEQLLKNQESIMKTE